MNAVEAAATEAQAQPSCCKNIIKELQEMCTSMILNVHYKHILPNIILPFILCKIMNAVLSNLAHT